MIDKFHRFAYENSCQFFGLEKFGWTRVIRNDLQEIIIFNLL